MRAATRKWIQRARAFQKGLKKDGKAKTMEWARGFRRQAKLVAALIAVQR